MVVERQVHVRDAEGGRLLATHSDGDGDADHLLPNGTVVARCGRRVAFRHLHHGNRRVSVETAEALADASHARAPATSPPPPA